MESFFGTLKSEYFYLNKFENVKELEMGLKEYIHYYNNDGFFFEKQFLFNNLQQKVKASNCN